MRKLAAAACLLTLAACAKPQPTVYYGVDGGRTGFNGVQFEQAAAECEYQVDQWATTGFGDPFYRKLSGGKHMLDKCMRSKGFTP